MEDINSLEEMYRFIEEKAGELLCGPIAQSFIRFRDNNHTNLESDEIKKIQVEMIVSTS